MTTGASVSVTIAKRRNIVTTNSKVLSSMTGSLKVVKSNYMDHGNREPRHFFQTGTMTFSPLQRCDAAPPLNPCGRLLCRRGGGRGMTEPELRQEINEIRTMAIRTDERSKSNTHRIDDVETVEDFDTADLLPTDDV